MPNQPLPRKSGRALIVVVAIIAAIVVVTFVGLNLSHYKVNQQENHGQQATDPAAAAKGPHDLQTEPKAKPTPQQ